MKNVIILAFIALIGCKKAAQTTPSPASVAPTETSTEVTIKLKSYCPTGTVSVLWEYSDEYKDSVYYYSGEAQIKKRVKSDTVRIHPGAIRCSSCPLCITDFTVYSNGSVVSEAKGSKGEYYFYKVR